VDNTSQALPYSTAQPRRSHAAYRKALQTQAQTGCWLGTLTVGAVLGC